MVRLSLAIALAAAVFGVSAAPTGSGKAVVVSLPFSRAISSPNWKQAVTADKNRAARFGGKSKTVELAVASSSVTAENVDFSYVTNVKVGTQTFSLIVDTGKYSCVLLFFISLNSSNHHKQVPLTHGLVLAPSTYQDPRLRTLVIPCLSAMEVARSLERNTLIPLLWVLWSSLVNPLVMLHLLLDSLVLMASLDLVQRI
jgi:hypothetical protein